MNIYQKTNITKDDINQMVSVPEISNTDIKNAEMELRSVVRDFYNKEVRKHLDMHTDIEEWKGL